MPSDQVIVGDTELAILSNVAVRTIRYYEGLGLLQPEIVGLERRYRASDLLRLQLIQKGKRFGFSLDEIKRLIDAAPKPLAVNEVRDDTSA